MNLNDLKPGVKIWTAILGELKKEYKNNPEQPYQYIVSKTYFNKQIGREVYDTYPNPPIVKYNIKSEIKDLMDKEFQEFIDKEITKEEKYEYWINRQDKYYRKYEWTELTISKIIDYGHGLIYYMEDFYDDIQEKTIPNQQLLIQDMFYKEGEVFIRIVNNNKRYNKEGILI